MCLSEPGLPKLVVNMGKSMGKYMDNLWIWLMVWSFLKKKLQLGWLFPIWINKLHVQDHQPEDVPSKCYMGISQTFPVHLKYPISWGNAFWVLFFTGDANWTALLERGANRIGKFVSLYSMYGGYLEVWLGFKHIQQLGSDSENPNTVMFQLCTLTCLSNFLRPPHREIPIWLITS